MLENTCGFLIKQINDLLEKKGNQELEKYGITMSQHSALFILASSESFRLDYKQLEHRLGVAQSTAAGIVKRLHQKGLVKIIPSSSDRRVKQVELTEKGLLCVERSKKRIEQMEQMLLAPLSPAEKEQLLSMLIKIRNTV